MNIQQRIFGNHPRAEAGEGGEEGGGEAVNDDADLGTEEERAVRMGWSPKDKYRGDPARWVDAATYIKNGEEALPILRERLKKLERTNIELSQSVTSLREMNDKTFATAYARAKRELEGELKVATKEGDEAAAVKAANDLADLERQKTERKADDGKDPVFDAWVKENPWYSDVDNEIDAMAEASRLRRKGEKAEGLPFLEKVKAAMMKRYPEKFKNPRREQGGPVERSVPGGEGGGGAKGWEGMPADAKADGERFIKQKLFKDKAAYAKSFWAQFD